MPDEKPCGFCCVDRERNRVLREGLFVLVILSNPRLMEGHTLVIPKRHVGAVGSLPWYVRLELFWTVFRFERKIVRAFSRHWGRAVGVDTSWHTRPFMPTTDLTMPGHAHVHLRPRFFKDPFYERVSFHETNVFQWMDSVEKATVQALLEE